MKFTRQLQIGMFVCGVLISFGVQSQQNLFLYIQSDSKSPFYVRLGSATYSSSTHGHIILPELKDSTYQLTIGFPRHQYPEQTFTIPMNKKDRGFELKNQQEQGWSLYDWQAIEFIRSPKAAANSSGTSGVKRTDSFAFLMAAVVNDSAVLYKSPEPEAVPIAKSSNKPLSIDSVDTRSALDSGTALTKVDAQDSSETVVAAIEAADTKAIDTLGASNRLQSSGTLAENARETDSVHTTVPAADSLAAVEQSAAGAMINWKLAQDSSAEGITYTFIDHSSPAKDTILFTIPSEGSADSTTPPQMISEEDVPSTNTTGGSSGIVMINSDCRKFASENDVDKLRVIILKQKNDNQRLDAAEKVFKTMCFSTKQVRALSELFSRDETRFNFFSAAYPFVSDSSSFKTLVDLLSDPFFVAQFKRLVRS